MGYEFTKITDVDIVETSTETTNVLVEMDGTVKRVPVKEIGGAGVSSWNDLTDRPFYEATYEEILFDDIVHTNTQRSARYEELLFEIKQGDT